MDTQLKNDLNEELKELEEKNLLWNPKTLEGPSVARSKVGGKEVLMLCSNNYLGLSNNPILKEAAKKALEGEEIVILNCENIVVSSSKDFLLSHYKQKQERV